MLPDPEPVTTRLPAPVEDPTSGRHHAPLDEHADFDRRWAFITTDNAGAVRLAAHLGQALCVVAMLLAIPLDAPWLVVLGVVGGLAGALVVKSTQWGETGEWPQDRFDDRRR